MTEEEMAEEKRAFEAKAKADVSAALVDLFGVYWNNYFTDKRKGKDPQNPSNWMIARICKQYNKYPYWLDLGDALNITREARLRSEK